MFQTPENRPFASVGTDPTIGEILSFLSLPNGWCYGYGRPAPVDSAINALRILSLLRRLGFDHIESFPDPSGAVLLSAFFDEASIGILCKTGSKFDCTIERLDVEVFSEDNVEEDVVISKIWELSCQTPKSSSVYCIHGSTTLQSVVLKALPSKTTMAVSHWSSLSVQSTQVVRYVATFQGSTHNYQETRQYIGESATTNSLKEQDLSWSCPTPVTNVIVSQSEFQIGLTRIGSVESLSRISKYVRQTG